MSIFNQVPPTRISRSRHNLSHQNRASFDAGAIVPILTELAFPGDTWKVGLEQFVRTMPMIAPLMDIMDIKVDAFFVPLRLIWDDFEDYITLGLTGEFTATPPTISLPVVTPPNAATVSRFNRIFGVGGLSDYLNFPTNLDYENGVEHPAVKLDAIPFRAYQLIYNEYYLNESIDTPIPLITSSGNSEISINSATRDPDFFCLRYRGWRKDYFTSALPSPQKGPAVQIPYGDLSIGAKKNTLGTQDVPMRFKNEDNNKFIGTDAPVFADGYVLEGDKIGALMTDTEDSDGVHEYSRLIYEDGLRIVGSNLPTIEELRYAETLQEFYEANARGGTRYKEHLLNIWHTRSKDSRLDRPEYLGGYRGPITISDIDQTSQSATTAQGTLAGKGVSAGGNRLFRYHVPEWGIIMVTMSVVPKSSYYQGFRRWNLYQDVFDWPNPFFANLGEQEIFNEELYYDPSNTDSKNEGTFGYTPRYSEAKYIPSSVHGQFKTTLDYWHLARKFGSRPNLNSAFLHINPAEVARIFPSQVTANDKFIGTFFFHVDRKMYLPYWGVPRLIHSI